MANKIGILTWHYYSNYGSGLQAFALQELIKSLGYDANIINYRDPRFGKDNVLKNLVKDIINKTIGSFNSKIYEKTHRGVHEYQKAYLGLTGQKETPVLKESSYEQVASRIYGDEYQKEIRKLREYTFSIDDHPFYDLFFTELSERKRRAEDKKYQAYLAGIREIQGYFSNEIREGSRLEGLGKLESAIELYERLVAEKKNKLDKIEYGDTKVLLIDKI